MRWGQASRTGLRWGGGAAVIPRSYFITKLEEYRIAGIVQKHTSWDPFVTANNFITNGGERLLVAGPCDACRALPRIVRNLHPVARTHQCSLARPSYHSDFKAITLRKHSQYGLFSKFTLSSRI